MVSPARKGPSQGVAKLHIAFEGPIGKALEIISGNMAEIVSAEESELVVTRTVEDCFRHLQAGKRVIQFVIPGEPEAAGFETAPLFAERFRIFRLFEKDGSDGVITFLEMLNAPTKENA